MFACLLEISFKDIAFNVCKSLLKSDRYWFSSPTDRPFKFFLRNLIYFLSSEKHKMKFAIVLVLIGSILPPIFGLHLFVGTGPSTQDKIKNRARRDVDLVS